MMKIRQSCDHFIFIMGIPILVVVILRHGPQALMKRNLVFQQQSLYETVFTYSDVLAIVILNKLDVCLTTGKNTN